MIFQLFAYVYAQKGFTFHLQIEILYILITLQSCVFFWESQNNCKHFKCFAYFYILLQQIFLLSSWYFFQKKRKEKISHIKTEEHVEEGSESLASASENVDINFDHSSEQDILKEQIEVKEDSVIETNIALSDTSSNDKNVGLEKVLSHESCEGYVNAGKENSVSTKEEIKSDEKLSDSNCEQCQIEPKNISGTFCSQFVQNKFLHSNMFLGLAKVEKLQTEQIDFEKLLNKSKDLMKEIKLQDLHESTKTVIEEIREVSKVSIKPYTESQLSALYHNSELETLDTFITQYVDAELKGNINSKL